MSERQDRYERTLQRQLSELISELKDPRVPMVVTVERVRVNADYSQARVLVSALGGEEELTGLQAALDGASGFLQRELGRVVQSKKTPRLSFYTDPANVL